MIESIITASCSLASALLVAIMNNSLVKYRLDALEKQMDRHSGMDDRLIVIETKVNDITNRVKELERRSEHE